MKKLGFCERIGKLGFGCEKREEELKGVAERNVEDEGRRKTSKVFKY